MPVGIVVEVGILADIERAVGARQKFREIAFDVACDGKIFRIFPQGIGLAVLPEILRLERHDLFEMRMAPGARFGILVHAAPDRIDQRNGGIQRLPGALDRCGVAGLGARDRKVHAVGVDVFLVLAPAAEFFLVGFVDVLRQRRPPFLIEESGGRRLHLEGLADRRAG